MIHYVSIDTPFVTNFFLVSEMNSLEGGAKLAGRFSTLCAVPCCLLPTPPNAHYYSHRKIGYYGTDYRLPLTVAQFILNSRQHEGKQGWGTSEIHFNQTNSQCQSLALIHLMMQVAFSGFESIQLTAQMVWSQEMIRISSCLKWEAYDSESTHDPTLTWTHFWILVWL